MDDQRPATRKCAKSWTRETHVLWCRLAIHQWIIAVDHFTFGLVFRWGQWLRRYSQAARRKLTRVSACPQIFITRHSLVRAKGEVFVLLLLFCSFFCQRFLDNPQANSRQILHAGVLWFRMCLLPFWGLAAPGGRKRGEMKFLLLWESMGIFCILAVFERYLSNACTDLHQILFV